MLIPAEQQAAERSRYRDGWLTWARRRSVTADGRPSDLADNASDTRAGVLGVQASPGEAAASARRRASVRRDQSPQARLHAADQRDAAARTRDLEALTRDQASDARNLMLAQRDAADEHDSRARTVSGSEVIVLAAGNRKRAARQRAQAAEQDARAAEDRHAAARDREQAALERVHALVDRELLANALALAADDALTSARAGVGHR